MAFRAGFEEVDITPPKGTKKAGWMQDLDAEVFLDPIFAKIAILADGKSGISFIQLDLLSIRWTHVQQLRNRIAEQFGFPGENIMIGATHNHAGPAIANLDPVPAQTEYINELDERIVAGFGQALSNMTDARAAFNYGFEFNASDNRRIVQRDGTTKTHGSFKSKAALQYEGPIDPELAVLGVKDLDDNWLGTLVNFTCHPTHHGGTTEISAGYPGELSRLLRESGCPVNVFLNGACGNVHTADPTSRRSDAKEMVARTLCNKIQELIAEMDFTAPWEIGMKKESVPVDYRDITEDEFKGRVFGAQRFRDDELYESFIKKLQTQIEAGKRTFAEIQVLRVGEICFVSMPAEYFVELGLRIKQETDPLHALIVGSANGMVGYVPTQDAFKRGGYETTLGPPSRMAFDTGDRMADTAIKLINSFV